MNYYFDTEFHEYKTVVSKGFFSDLKTVHLIELISIGIISQDGKKYYAISKEFDIKAAWNGYQLEQVSGDQRNIFPEGKKVYWLRENVLKPIFQELWYEKCHMMNLHHTTNDFTYRNFKRLISIYGKTQKQIQQEIFEFVCPYEIASHYAGVGSIDIGAKAYLETHPPVFYAYFADYDWVVFCMIFGKMLNLPDGFPWYCRDLKQEFDTVADSYYSTTEPLSEKINRLKKHPLYPKQENEHNALADAEWNMRLHDFINKARL